MIPIYEAVDDKLLKWKYRGVFLNETVAVRIGSKNNKNIINNGYLWNIKNINRVK